MGFMGSLAQRGRPALAVFAVSVVVFVTLGGIGAIVYDLAFAPERRPATQIPSDVYTVRLCPSIVDDGMRIHEMQEHARQWETHAGEPFRRVDLADDCPEHAPPGVVHVRLCSDGGQCDSGEGYGQATTEGSDRIESATIWVRDRFRREPWHVWHELGHAFGYGVEPHPGSDDGHDEHEGRVMSRVAGWRWEGI